MTLKRILDQIEAIKQASDGDFELAHSLEDKLYKQFVQALAERRYSYKIAVELAQVIASTNNIKFPRHCA